MQKSPFFTVVIPTFNRAELLNNAIKSVRDQKYESWELLVIDDGSEDATKSVVEFYSDPRIKYRYIKHSGRGAARNKGLELAQGQWICFLDSDEMYRENHLERLNQEIVQHSNTFVFRTGIEYQYRGKSRFQDITYPSDLEGQISYLWHYYFPLINICIHSELAKRFTFSDHEAWEDKAYLQKVLLEYRYRQLPEYTVLVPEHPGRSILDIKDSEIKLADQVQCIKEAHAFLSEKSSDMASKISLDKILSRTIFDNALNARYSGNRRRYLELGIRAYKLKPGFRIFLKLIWYLIF